jgi:hypothetical protein
MVAELIGDGALGVEDRPVRPLRRVGARQNVGGFRQAASVGERLAEGAEHLLILRVVDGETLQHGHCLSVTRQGAQDARMRQSVGLVARIGVVTSAGLRRILAQRGLVFRKGRVLADGAGDVAHLGAGAEADSQRQHGRRQQGAGAGQSGQGGTKTHRGVPDRSFFSNKALTLMEC